MADNLQYADPSSAGTGETLKPVATDEVGSVHYQLVQLVVGADGGAKSLVTGSTGLPVAVQGTVPVTGTFWQATQPVSIASTVTVTGAGGTFPVTDGGGSLTVDGTVAVSSVGGSVAVTGTFWPATQPVSISSAVSVTDGGGSLTVDGTVAVSGTVTVGDGGGSLTVDDGGGSLTVDGTVAITWTAGTGSPADTAVTSGLYAGGDNVLKVAAAYSDENGGWAPLSLDSLGNLQVAVGATVAVEGANADGALAVSRVLVVGGRANTTLPTNAADGRERAFYLDAQGALHVNAGGAATASVASGAGNTVVKASRGRLCRVLVTTAGTGTGSVLIYDHASSASGTVIGVIPATVAIGQTYEFDMPAANGITVANVASGPVLTVSYR